jgi:tripartite-type tricarboxylate transporter receptor subunit TctC
MVPSEGASDAATKVASGHAVLLTGAIPNFSSLIEAGKLKILGIQAEERSPYFPDVPTFKENGIEVRTLENWAGISLPAGTPENVVKKWEESIKKMQEDPEFLEKFDNMENFHGLFKLS